MKTLLTLFVLLFSSSLFADDISDLEIEEISVGSSLLNYYSEEDIKKNIYDQISQIRDRKFYDVMFFSSKFKEYQAIQVSLKFDDKNYIIYGIDGLISFGDRIEDCFKQQIKITKILMEQINYVDFEERDLLNHFDYNDGTKTKDTFIGLKNRDQIIISCTDAPENSGGDYLRVGLWSKELNDWLTDIK